jgi:phosphoribosylformimino-5-aminoimidazole carboxamide ribotide isomerase
MRVIGVIDLLGSEVVRGVAGRRETYRPIQSQICADAKPTSVARAYQRLGVSEIYVADLDLNAIAGAVPAWAIYEDLLATGCCLLIDAGVRDASQAQQIAGLGVDVVVGLETLPDLADLREITLAVSRERLVFSLDMKSGQPLAQRDVAQLSAEQIADAAVALGVQRMIVLDLAHVGVNQGLGTFELCRVLRHRHSRIEIISGGGVRGIDDLRDVANSGCNAALVASALHDGRLTASDIAALSAASAKQTRLS